MEGTEKQEESTLRLAQDRRRFSEFFLLKQLKKSAKYSIGGKKRRKAELKPMKYLSPEKHLLNLSCQHSRMNTADSEFSSLFFSSVSPCLCGSS